MTLGKTRLLYREIIVIPFCASSNCEGIFCENKRRKGWDREGEGGGRNGEEESKSEKRKEKEREGRRLESVSNSRFIVISVSRVIIRTS